MCANVLARLKDLLDRDESLTDRERKALDKRLELFLFSEEVRQQPTTTHFPDPFR